MTFWHITLQWDITRRRGVVWCGSDIAHVPRNFLRFNEAIGEQWCSRDALVYFVYKNMKKASVVWDELVRKRYKSSSLELLGFTNPQSISKLRKNLFWNKKVPFEEKIWRLKVHSLHIYIKKAFSDFIYFFWGSLT